MNKNKQIAELIHRRREQMLVHSYIYYQLNDNIIDDSTWSKWAMKLQKMCEKPTTLVVGVSVDEGGWDEDIQAVPVEAIKGLAKLDIVRCKDCKFYGANMTPSVRSLGFSHHCCRQVSVCPVRENDFCSYGVRKEQ